MIPITVKIAVAARAAGISRSTLYTYMASGVWPYLKAKRSHLILVADLEAFLRNLRQDGLEAE